MADSATDRDSPQMSEKTLPNTAEKASPDTSPAPTSPATPQPRFKFSSTVPQRSTWYNHKKTSDDSHPLYYVKIVIEQSDLPQGALICERVPRKHLFELAPKLDQYLDVTNTKVILPANSVDDDTVHDVVTAIVIAGEQKTKFTMHFKEIPVTLIKIHAVLALFGTNYQAEIVRSQAWASMAIHELSPQEVDWIWDTFGVWDSGVEAEMDIDTSPQQYNKEEVKRNVKLWKVVNKNKNEADSEQAYVAPHAQEYVEMMAYQILNLQALGTLKDVILEMILGRCPSLKKVLEMRKERYGLAPGYEALSSPLDLPISTSNMTEKQPKTTLKDVKKRKVPLTPTPVPKRVFKITKPPPHRTPVMEAALNRKPSVLNLSRATAGITVDRPNEGRGLPQGGAVSSWIDQDPNKASKSPSSFPTGAPMFTSGGFMNSVYVSMKMDDEEVNMFGESSVNPATGPQSFQRDSSSGRISVSGNTATTSQNGNFSGRVFGTGTTPAGLAMVEQATQTGRSLCATWSFLKQSESGSSSFGSASSPTATFRGGNDTPKSTSDVFRQQSSTSSDAYGSFGSFQPPSPGPSTMSLSGNSLVSFNNILDPQTKNMSFGFGPPAGSNSSFQHQEQSSTQYPSTVIQSFNSFSSGSTTATSTPTQSFINQAAFSGFGTGETGTMNGTGNGIGFGSGDMNGDNGAAGGGANMFAFQSNGSFGTKKKATLKGRRGGRR